MTAIDTNLLVYAHRERTSQHKRARQALERAAAAPRGWGMSAAVLPEFCWASPILHLSTRWPTPPARSECGGVSVDSESATTWLLHRVWAPPVRIASLSGVSGRSEIYLQPFPGPGERVTVSSSGGRQAQCGDGKELFYLTPAGTMISVEVRAGARLDLATPRPLFTTGLRPNTSSDQYVVTADGQRFIVMEPPTDAQLDAITIVTNWTTLLMQ